LLAPRKEQQSVRNLKTNKRHRKAGQHPLDSCSILVLPVLFLLFTSYCISSHAWFRVRSCKAAPRFLDMRVTLTLAVSAVGNRLVTRVVGMLHKMQAKVEAADEQATLLYKKYQCFCDRNQEALHGQLDEVGRRVGASQNEVESDKAQRAQVVADLAIAKEHRDQGAETLAKAADQRKKEQKEFETQQENLATQADQLARAVEALQRGTRPSLLQLAGVTRATEASSSLTYEERQQALDFLQGGSGNSQDSSEIVGVLEKLRDEAEDQLKELRADEAEHAEDYASLVEAETKAVAAATQAAEEHTDRAAQLAVALVDAKSAARDDARSQAALQGTLSRLEADCRGKAAAYNQLHDGRLAEQQVLAEALEALSSDEARGLFKKSPLALLQVDSSSLAERARAIVALQGGAHSVHLDLVATALRDRRTSFSVVIQMIDKMSDALRKEQKDDDRKKAYCEQQQKQNMRSLADTAHSQQQIEQDQEWLEATVSDLKATVSAHRQESQGLDRAVAEATQQRQQEHEGYVSAATQTQAAVELLEFVEKKLAGFYKNKASLAQVRGQKAAANGVLGLLQHLSSQLRSEMHESELAEQDAQRNYEELLADATTQRAAQTVGLQHEEGLLADAAISLAGLHQEAHFAAHTRTSQAEMGRDLKATCKDVLEAYEDRKKARAEELEALDKAKAVLGGADLDLVQTGRSTRRFLG